VTAAEHVDENIERIYIGQKKVFQENRDGESLSKMGGPGGSAPTRSKADTGSTGTHVPLSTDLAKEHKHPLASYALSEVVHDIGRSGRALKGRGEDLLSISSGGLRKPSMARIRARTGTSAGFWSAACRGSKR
jgi:hypothetical protein